LTKLQDGVKLHPSKEGGVNYNYEKLSTYSKLNDEKAFELVSQWRKMGNDDNYEEPSSVTAGKFIVQAHDVHDNVFEVIQNVSHQI